MAQNKIHFYILFVCIYSVLSGVSLREADAEEIGGDSPLKAYVSAHGFVNGSFISTPNEKTVSEYPGILLVYPGFGGLGGGAGAELGISWKALSLDVGFDYSSDQAKGSIDDISIIMNQTSYHIPLTLRVSVPQAKLIRPSLFGGVNWVSTSGVELDNSYFSFIEAPVDESYTAWRFGLGLEIFVNEKMSIPFRIQAVYAPLNSENLDERVDNVVILGNSLQNIRFKSKWEWQPQVSLGFTYYFDLDSPAASAAQ